ncbi:SAF domain-containing protein [Chloroflexota bacterium]
MSRRVIGIIIAVVGIGVAIIGVFSIRQILTSSLTPPPAPTQQVAVTEQVVVVTRDYSLGDVVKENGLQVVDMPVELIPRNAMGNIENIVGRMVKVRLVSGEIVQTHHLADPTNISHDIGYIMSDKMVMLAFPAGDLMSSLNVLERGDLVDILVTLDQTVELVKGESDEPAGPGDQIITVDETPEYISRSLTFDAMQATDISAVIANVEYEEGTYASVPLGTDSELPASSERYPSSVKVKAYLLILNPQDALLLKHLKDTGARFDFVLRAPTSDQLFDLQTVMSEYLIDRYQLEVPK